MQPEGEAVERGAEEEERDEPPDAAQAGVSEGEVGRMMGGGAAVDDGEVVHGEFPGEVGPEDGGDAVGEEDEARLQVGEVEAGLEEGGGAGGDHAPDGVDDGAEEDGGEDVFLKEELERTEEHGWGEGFCRGEVLLDEMFLGGREAVIERAVDAFEADAPVSRDGTERLWQEDDED